MKILFFSDVHGSPDSFAMLERQMAVLQPELLCLLGDVLYHGPRNPLKPDYAPPAVVDQINGYADRIMAVRGNCDCEVDQMLLHFPVMGDYAQLYADGTRFFLTHGHLWQPEEPPQLTAGTVFASGHTHLPRLEKLENGLIAFNPGSISLPKGGNPPSFGWYDNGSLAVLNLESGEPMLSLACRECLK